MAEARGRYPEPLTRAIQDAGEELVEKYHWCIDPAGDKKRASVNDEFVQVVAKHVAGLVDVSSWREARMEALRAELAALEEQERERSQASESR